MIKEGQQKIAKGRGEYRVEEVVRLKKPVPDAAGECLFNPTLVRIHWIDPPQDEDEFWWPYWLTIKGKERYGQYAPMHTEGVLLELLQEAIRKGFFSKNFLHQLQKAISDKLNSG